MNKIKGKKLNKNFRGFSLLEMLISMFVFVLAITVAVSVFSTVTFNRKKTREIQKDIEDVRGALDLMAKNMRMSTGLNGTTSEVYMFNNSQGVCIEYRFRNDGGNSYLEMGQAIPTSASRECLSGDVTNFERITSNNVSGSFIVVPTIDQRIGKATILLIVDGINLETSVSFRDYDFSK